MYKITEGIFLTDFLGLELADPLWATISENDLFTWHTSVDDIQRVQKISGLFADAN